MTSLCAGEGALSVELWFLSDGLAEGGLLLVPPLAAVLLLLVVVPYTIAALLAGLRVVAVIAGDVGIKSEWQKGEIVCHQCDIVQCMRNEHRKE